MDVVGSRPAASLKRWLTKSATYHTLLDGLAEVNALECYVL